MKKIKNNTISVLFPPLSNLPIYHYLHKKHAKLVSKLDAVFKKMQDRGEPESIRNTVIAEMLAAAVKK